MAQGQAQVKLCPECFKQGRVNVTAYDEFVAVHVCDACQCMWTDQQFMERWIEVQLELNEQMPVKTEEAM
jgi:hypothetical protein